MSTAQEPVLSRAPDTLSVDELTNLVDLHQQQREDRTINESSVLENPASTDVDTWPVHMFVFLTSGSVPATLPQRFASLIRLQAKRFVVKGNTLYRRMKVDGYDLLVPYLKTDHRRSKMEQLHAVMGHLKSPSTFKSLQLRWWWPRMDPDYKAFLAGCSLCQLHDSDKHPVAAPLHPLPDPGIPFHTWHIDWIQDLPESSRGNSQIAVAVDKSTRMVVAHSFPNRNTDSCLSFLYGLMVRFGCPSQVISDRASVFLSLEFKKFCSINAIRHSASTSYHPQTNGLVERVNGVLEGMLGKLCAGATDKWDSYLDAAVFNLNARTHTVTGYSPFFLAFGFHPRLPGDTTSPHVFDFGQNQDRLTLRKATPL
jgi:transposase InsO family protein